MKKLNYVICDAHGALNMKEKFCMKIEDKFFFKIFRQI